MPTPPRPSKKPAAKSRKAAAPKPVAPRSASRARPVKPAPKPEPTLKPKPRSRSRRPRPRSARSSARLRCRLPSRRAPAQGSQVFPIELDVRELEATLAKVGGELRHWANKGRYTKVRFKFRGKQLLPDLPLAAVAAAEGLTFYWGGILRALVMNVAGGSLLQVELVNDADAKVQQGRERLLSGDVDAALALFREALSMDRDNPRAELNRGVALKLKGDPAAAREALARARALDPDGPVGAEADKVLASLPPPV